MTYKEKIQSMTDTEVDTELGNVSARRALGYQMLGSGDLMIQASITLCDDAIEDIKLEKSNRVINSRKA